MAHDLFTQRGTVPLYKALSKAGFASRNQARQWIVAGEVEVDGKTCRNPEQPVQMEIARIHCHGILVTIQPTRVLLLYKPRGVITSHSDPQGRPTIYSLLPQEFVQFHSVGRLDWATSGVLLITNDTLLSSWLTDPAHQISRVYVVTVRGCVTQETVTAMMAGIEDASEVLQAEKVNLRKVSRKESHLLITLNEGKNREIRRLFAHFGYEVTHLKRIAFGGLASGDLMPGKYREISLGEVKRAFPGVQMRTSSA
ncbi:pseudouridine synthase [Candidatus Vecturithrix granuli]|uniref:Pseudouridine synthase n=1 Tax=Vecturithrix granuli TaxID=1499967 RepID=A0A0S6W5Q4_VECG1|nr:pseudouridine synthase [Candidatus Vecturithrix granuli]